MVTHSSSAEETEVKRGHGKYVRGKTACEWSKAVATAGTEHGGPSLWLPPYNPNSLVICVNMGVTVQQETQSQE